MEFGLYSFGDLPPEKRGAEAAHARIHQLIQTARLADEAGLAVFGLGEHHRADFVVSAPAVVLAAAAMRTKRIRLTSAVSVLSSDDPVRVLQQFATVDLLSGGRAEIMAGRGSFIESFPLFGYDLRKRLGFVPYAAGGVQRVDVSVDGGRNWKAATLQEPVLSRALTRFRLPWQWDGSPAILQSRAIDESGYVQPTRAQLVAQRGLNSNYHYNAIQSWSVAANGEISNVHA